MDWKNVEVVMAYSSMYWYTIMKRMKKIIWIAGIVIVIQTECPPNTSEMCQTHKACWPILVAATCQIQAYGVRLAWTMATDHIRDSRTHHASHREHLLPLFYRVDCQRHASEHDGKTYVSCWMSFHSHSNNMQMHLESLVFGSFQYEHMCNPVTSK